MRNARGHTEFAIEGVDCPVHISLATRNTGHVEGDSAASIIERIWSRDPAAAKAAA